MEFLLKVAYYGVAGISTFLVLFFSAANLADQGTKGVKEFLILLVSAGVAIGLLGGCFYSGHMHGHWLAGILFAAGAVVAGGLLLLLGTLLFTQVHWQ